MPHNVDVLFNRWVDEQDADPAEKEQFRRDPKAKLLFMQNMDKLITQDVSKFPPELPKQPNAAPMNLSEGAYATKEDRDKLTRQKFAGMSPEMVRTGANVLPAAGLGAMAGGPIGAATGAASGIGMDILDRLTDDPSNPQQFTDASLPMRLISPAILNRLGTLSKGLRLPSQMAFQGAEGASIAALNNKFGADIDKEDPMLRGGLGMGIGMLPNMAGNSFTDRAAKQKAITNLSKELSPSASPTNITPNVKNLQADIQYWLSLPQNEAQYAKAGEKVQTVNTKIGNDYLKQVRRKEATQSGRDAIFDAKSKSVDDFNDRYLSQISQRKEDYGNQRAILQNKDKVFSEQAADVADELSLSQGISKDSGELHREVARRIYDGLRKRNPNADNAKQLDFAIRKADEAVKLSNPVKPADSPYKTDIADLDATSRPPNNPLDFLQSQPSRTKELPPILPTFVKQEPTEEILRGQAVSQRAFSPDALTGPQITQLKKLRQTDTSSFAKEVFGDLFDPENLHTDKSKITARVKDSISLIHKISSDADRPQLMQGLREGFVQNLFRGKDGKVDPLQVKQIMQALGQDTFDKVFSNYKSYDDLMKIVEAAQDTSIGSKLRVILGDKLTLLLRNAPVGVKTAMSGAGPVSVGALLGAASPVDAMAGAGIGAGYKVYSIGWDQLARMASSPNNRMATMINSLATNRGNFSEATIRTVEKYLDSMYSFKKKEDEKK